MSQKIELKTKLFTILSHSLMMSIWHLICLFMLYSKFAMIDFEILRINYIQQVLLRKDMEMHT